MHNLISCNIIFFYCFSDPFFQTLTIFTEWRILVHCFYSLIDQCKLNTVFIMFFTLVSSLAYTVVKIKSIFSSNRSKYISTKLHENLRIIKRGFSLTTFHGLSEVDNLLIETTIKSSMFICKAYHQKSYLRSIFI
jgi:hypothetical protein